MVIDDDFYDFRRRSQETAEITNIRLPPRRPRPKPQREVTYTEIGLIISPRPRPRPRPPQDFGGLAKGLIIDEPIFEPDGGEKIPEYRPDKQSVGAVY